MNMNHADGWPVEMFMAWTTSSAWDELHWVISSIIIKFRCARHLKLPSVYQDITRLKENTTQKHKAPSSSGRLQQCVHFQLPIKITKMAFKLLPSAAIFPLNIDVQRQGVW